MSRFPQQPARRGSQKWLQILINDHPQLINRLLVPRLQLAAGDSIVWLSPLKDDGYAEYRDAEFLGKLGVILNQRSLNDFWPRWGPQWDGLGKTDFGKLVLVEAKSHLKELISSPTGATGRSLTRIQESLGETKRFLRSKTKADWATCFYQYTNRLAHLYLLRQVNEIPAFLVFVYFTNDVEMDGPRSEREWRAATTVRDGLLGIHRHALSKYVVETFIDAQKLVLDHGGKDGSHCEPEHSGGEAISTRR